MNFHKDENDSQQTSFSFSSSQESKEGSSSLFPLSPTSPHLPPRTTLSPSAPSFRPAFPSSPVQQKQLKHLQPTTEHSVIFEKPKYELPKAFFHDCSNLNETNRYIQQMEFDLISSQEQFSSKKIGHNHTNNKIPNNQRIDLIDPTPFLKQNTSSSLQETNVTLSNSFIETLAENKKRKNM